MKTSRFVRNLGGEPFAAALGFLAAQSGLRGIFDPSTLPLLAIIGWVAYVWAVVYMVGGLVLLYGIGSTRVRYEAAGSILFGGGALVQAAVTALFVGRNPFLTYWSVIALFIFGIAGLYRATRILRGQRLMWVKLP